LSETYVYAEWLVTYFHSLALDRQNVENEAAGRKVQHSISEGRLEKFHESAIQLLLDHPLAEVVEVIDWVYTDCNGYLPQSLVDRNKDRKLTRLRQILNCYGGLREAMTLGIPRPPDEQPKKVDQTEVDELVAKFAEFRTSFGDRNITGARTANWAKTFRIMLRGGRSFDDIKAIIAAVHECPDYVDQQRYHDAYDFNRTGESVRLQGYVEIHKLMKAKKAARSQVVPPPKADADDWVDEDDYDRRPTRKPTGWTSDYSSWEGIRRRRARYAARAAKGDLEKRPGRDPLGMPLFRPSER
jgi:hypothetical protein